MERLGFESVDNLLDYQVGPYKITLSAVAKQITITTNETWTYLNNSILSSLTEMLDLTDENTITISENKTEITINKLSYNNLANYCTYALHF